MRVLSDTASTAEPGICSAQKYSVARKGTAKPATLGAIRHEQHKMDSETCVEIGSKMVITKRGNGGSIEVILRACIGRVQSMVSESWDFQDRLMFSELRGLV